MVVSEDRGLEPSESYLDVGLAILSDGLALN
jgi:hypothetical protein